MTVNQRALEQLATIFDKNVQDGQYGKGWGQFLDAHRSHLQVGLYGTCAGLLVRCLANRSEDPIALAAISELRALWDARTDEYGAKRFAQNIRLAVVNLTLSYLTSTYGFNGSEAETLRQEVSTELQRRILRTGMWGDYWQSEQEHDATPRLFTTSLALLSFGINQSQEPNESLLKAAKALEQRIASTENLPAHELLAAYAAIVSVKGNNKDSSLAKRVSRYAYSQSIISREQAVYFYDYEYGSKKRKFGRDYIIVPVDVLLGIAGFMPNTSGPLRLKAESITSKVRQQIDTSLGYLPMVNERSTTVNQAWCALLLSVADRPAASPSSYESAIYHLYRERPENWISRWLLPALAILVALPLAAIIIEREYEPQYFDIVAKYLASISIAVLGVINFDDHIRRLLGRSP